MKMIDTEKLKLLKLAGIGLVAILVLGLVFWFSLASAKPQKDTEEADPKTEQIKKTEGSELTSAYVKDFLSAYFTKKDLGENRNRYLPFMTEAAYQKEVQSEEEPSVKTYKGYVVDTKLKSATLYIDSENHVVLAHVSYTQTQLQKKYDYTNAQIDVLSSSTLRIHYIKQGEKYLISQIEPILIVDTLSADQQAGIPTLNQPIIAQNTEGE